MPPRVLTINWSDRHRKGARLLAIASMYLAPTIELSRDSLDATGQVIELKLSLLSPSSNDARKEEEEERAARTKKEENEIGKLPTPGHYYYRPTQADPDAIGF